MKFLIQNAKKYNIDLKLRNINGDTPFHYACYHGKVQIVEILLKNSKQHKINVVSVNNNGKDGQALAEQKGHTDILNLIKDWKRNQNYEELRSHIDDDLLFQLESFEGFEQSGDPRVARLIATIKLIKELKENKN